MRFAPQAQGWYKAMVQCTITPIMLVYPSCVNSDRSRSATGTKGKIYKINKYLPELSDSALMNWNGL